MKPFRFLLSLLVFAGWSLPAALPAMAQEQAQNPPQPSVSKMVGDWEVRCYPVNTGAPCDMHEVLAEKKTHQQIMSLSIAYLAARNVHILQIALPLGVDLAKGAVIAASNYKTGKLSYRRCDRGGCYVEMLIGDDALAALGTAGDSAKIKIAGYHGKVFDISFSLKGFAAARTEMDNLAKQKTAPGKPAAPAAPAGGQ